MKRLLLVPFFALSLAAQTTYFACSDAGNIDAANKFGTASSGTCTCTGAGNHVPVAVSGDILDANGCATTITVNVDPGDATHQAVLRSNATTSGAANSFTLATATCAGFTSGTAHIDAIGGKNSALAITGSTTGCNVSGLGTGGNTSGASGINDTHSTVTVTHTCSSTQPLTGGTASSSSTGYTFGGASGTVDASTCNALGGTAGPGISTSSNGTFNIKNCIGSDTSGGTFGCSGLATSTSGIIVKGAIVNGKFNAGASGRILRSPSSTAAASYSGGDCFGGTPTSYQSTDVVDSGGNVKASNAITYTNLCISPVAYTTSGIGTGCSTSDGTGCSNVKSGILAGPLTGSASAGQNSVGGN